MKVNVFNLVPMIRTRRFLLTWPLPAEMNTRPILLMTDQILEKSNNPQQVIRENLLKRRQRGR
jgi:hypothetical protein